MEDRVYFDKYGKRFLCKYRLRIIFVVFIVFDNVKLKKKQIIICRHIAALSYTNDQVIIRKIKNSGDELITLLLSLSINIVCCFPIISSKTPEILLTFILLPLSEQPAIYYLKFFFISLQYVKRFLFSIIIVIYKYT